MCDDLYQKFRPTYIDTCFQFHVFFFFCGDLGGRNVLKEIHHSGGGFECLYLHPTYNFVLLISEFGNRHNL